MPPKAGDAAATGRPTWGHMGVGAKVGSTTASMAGQANDRAACTAGGGTGAADQELGGEMSAQRS